MPEPLRHCVISDLHLGSPYCDATACLALLDSLPPGTELILNGDIINRWHPSMPPAHAAVLDALRRMSAVGRVVWIRGNHDTTPEPANLGAILRADEWRLPGRLLIRHGHEFDQVMHHNGFALAIFKFIHHLYLRIGGPAIHPAEFAKRFHLLYRAMCLHVARNAVRLAAREGFPAVTCGHTHCVEDRIINGVRYINTGSWTEQPHCALMIDDTHMHLKRLPHAGNSLPTASH